MFILSKRCGAAVVAAAAILVLAVAAPAQVPVQSVGQPGIAPPFQVSPATPGQFPGTFVGSAFSFVGPQTAVVNRFMGAPMNPYLDQFAMANRLANNPYGAGALTNNPYSNPYGGYYNPYTPYNYDPVGGYLRGSADVINAQGRFLESRQRALLMQQELEQVKLDTRRKQFEYWKYIRDNTPTPQDERERAQKEELRRSQNNPALVEVWSGKALNDLLEHAAKLQSAGKGLGPDIKLDEDTLKHVNVTSNNGGNIAVLRDGQLSWPQALRGEAFEADRKQLDQLAPEVVKQAQFGKVDPGTLRDLETAKKRIQDQLSRQVFETPPSQYIEGTRFLRRLDDALKALRSPDVSNYFTQKFAAKGKTAAELVKHMSSNGLRFAPAVSGDEAHYTALYNALVNYDLGLHAAAQGER